jgi:hypothetical protein
LRAHVTFGASTGIMVIDAWCTTAASWFILSLRSRICLSPRAER